MKKVAILGLAATTSAVIAAACSGGHKSGSGAGDLASGTYTVSNTQSASDGCAANGIFVDGQSLLIARSSSSDAISLAAAQGTIVNGVLHDVTTTQLYDWMAHGSPFNCKEEDTYLFEGATTSSNAADLVLTQTWVYSSGSQCAQAYAQYSAIVGQTVSLPCSSALKLHVERSGPLPVAVASPVPISGLLDTAAGFNAILTLTSGTPGGSMAYHATVDVALVLASSALYCLAPDPVDGYPNYELVSGNGFATGFDLSITTSSWVAGNVSLDTRNTLSFFQVDQTGAERDLTAIAGTATLYAAPTVVNDASTRCRFGLKNVPISGSRLASTQQSAAAPAMLHHPAALEVRRKKRLAALLSR